MENRLDKIKSVAIAKKQNEIEKAKQEVNYTQELLAKIKALTPRVKELCMLVSELDKNKLLYETTPRSYGHKKDLFTDGISHILGCAYVNENFKTDNYEARIFSWHRTNETPTCAIGIEGGGACDYNLYITENGVIFYNGRDYKRVMEYFLKEFDNFEKKVFDYIDNLKA